ncbi:acyl-CoA dehydrogenase [Methylobacillus arboreus]|uniref:acyl-CoA dehydrogenase family protein n=1 Tax=Methylobacillus arboreus TaxID=755170 RepID=UPI001E54B69F|nr:acyl-CoA dehydrogenase family protein [Methylobacillus arboreus]MCB5191837.1 acyl-CoA dehydrogenase [Methylobacillus arboreus]
MNAPSTGLNILSTRLETQLLGELEDILSKCTPVACASEIFNRLVENDTLTLPLPGHGNTLLRWKMLAAVAAIDLSAAKLYESHQDAVAILHEITQQPIPANTRWGAWAAECPELSLQARFSDRHDSTLHAAGFKQSVEITGTKSWCSGANILSHALVTAKNAENQPVLIAVNLDQPGVKITSKGWHALGMQETNSVDVEFNGAVGHQVGPPSAYLNRPGFWHGGGGIAACWYGAAKKLGMTLYSQLHKSHGTHAPFKSMHLGEVDVALAAAAALLRDSANAIDGNPKKNFFVEALRVRLAVESACEKVLSHTGKALGAAAFCKNAEFARMHADLTVFLRQSHAEKDLASLSEKIEGNDPWRL